MTKESQAYRRAVQRLTAGTRSLLVSDGLAAALLEYAVLIAQTRSGDTIRFQALDLGGEPTDVTLLLNSGLALTAESVSGTSQVPANRQAIAHLTKRLQPYELWPAPGTTFADETMPMNEH